MQNKTNAKSEDITDPTTAMNMALVLMAKAFKLKLLTPPTLPENFINPRNGRLLNRVMNMGVKTDSGDVLEPMVRNQLRQYAGREWLWYQRVYYAVQNRILIRIKWNGNVCRARAEGNATGNNDTVADCSKGKSRNSTQSGKEFDLMSAADDLDEIEDVNTDQLRYTTMNNCSDNEIFNMFTQEEQYTEQSKFVRDFKSLAKEADESLAKHKALELEIKRLLRAVVTIAFKQSSSKPGLQSMTSGQISSGLDLTYAPSTITSQKPTKRELDLLFEAMYDDYISGQPSAVARTALVAQAPQVLHNLTTSTTIADTALTPTNSSSQATNIPNTSHDVDELET
ncbi:hypothetical protein Tco_1153164 [Tanacetum coccineum]